MESVKGNLRLRFRVNGRQLTFSPGLSDTPENRKALELVRKQIELDILVGDFDPSFKKYRRTKPEHKSLVNVFAEFIAFKSKRCEKRSLFKYFSVLKNLENHKIGKLDYSFVSDSDVEIFVDWLKAKNEPVTVRDKIVLLRACYRWLKAQNNPWDISLVKVPAKPPRVGFDKHEIHIILSEFEERHPSYLEFVRFNFATGVRSGEAINLTWGNIAEDFKSITIYASKTNRFRTIPLPLSLQETLCRMKPANATPTDLVFTTIEGQKINLSNFVNRYWYPVLKDAGLEARSFYATRHTCASLWLQSGMNPFVVSKLLGNSVQVLMKNYASLIEFPELPEMF